MPGDAAQDIDLFRLQSRARKQAFQARHELFRVVRVEEVDGHQRLFQVRIHAVDLGQAGRVAMEADGAGRRRPVFPLQGRHPAFIGDDLRRLRQVQRGIRGVGGNVDQHIALLDDLVGQAEALVAEDDGRMQLRACGQLGRDGARRRDGRRKFAQPGRDGRRVVAAFERLGDGADDARAGQDILRAAGEGHRFRIRQGIGKAGVDQHQIGKTHRFHGPRDGANVAGSTSFDENKSQAFEKRRVDFGQIHLK
eukprot:gene21395-25705_t